MKRNKYKDYLWYTALAVFIICVIERIFFYHNVENPFLKVTLIIQNAIKAYKIDPDIKQAGTCLYAEVRWWNYKRHNNICLPSCCYSGTILC